MRIFLDFDGVLRRESSPKSKLDADCVCRLEQVVLSNSDARIVVTSTWRLVQPLHVLRQHFSPGFGVRVEGVTPDLPEIEEYSRHAEIQAYLAKHGVRGTRWIAIDDDGEEFRPGAPLILTNPVSGFDEECAQRLRDWLAQT